MLSRWCLLVLVQLSSASGAGASSAALKQAGASSADGSVSGEALQQVMRTGHIAHREQDSKTHLAGLASAVEKAFAELDKNSDGRIEKSEAFTKDEPKKEHSADDVFVQRQGGLWMTRRQELLWAFADTDADGNLSLDEFRVFHHPELHSTSEAGEKKHHKFLADVLLARADKDGDGKVSWEEFSARKEAERELYNWHKDGAKHGPVSERKAHAENARKQEKLDFENEGDVDGDGNLDIDELTRMIGKQQNLNFDLDHRQAMRELDADGDGTISTAEAANADKVLEPLKHLHLYFRRSEL